MNNIRNWISERNILLHYTRFEILYGKSNVSGFLIFDSSCYLSSVNKNIQKLWSEIPF